MIHFGPNISINGRSLGHRQHEYESEVDRTLALIQIEAPITGLAVIREIWQTARHVSIVPYPQANSHDVNADASPTNWAAAEPHGAPLYDGKGHRISGRGTGHGSSVLLRFTPWLFTLDQIPRYNIEWAVAWRLNGVPAAGTGFDRTEMLLHEMVHALEDMRGTLHPHPMGNHYDTAAEFNAILVTNLFSRERRRGVRASHDDAVGQGAGLSAHFTSMLPASQRAEFIQRVNQFRARLPSLANRLSRVSPPNPFRGFDSEMDSPFIDLDDPHP